MILDGTERWCVSSLGWVEHAALQVVDTESGHLHQASLGDADYVSIHPGTADVFSVVHHYRGGNQVRITVHRFEHPESAIAAMTMNGLEEVGRSAFTGDSEIWKLVRSGYVVFYGASLQAHEYSLIVIDPIRLQGRVQRFGWFDHKFDHGYEAPTDATPVPLAYYGTVPIENSLYAVAVQRVSKIFLYAPESDTLYRELELAGGRGGHAPIFRKNEAQAWLTDYNVLLCLDPRTWTVVHSRPLQGSVNGVGMFIGDIAFTTDESRCIVPRPGSGDVVAVDTSTFEIVGRATLGHQPLEAVALRDGRVIARDWKSGKLLRGVLQPS
jgi:hypothetical protein